MKAFVRWDRTLCLQAVVIVSVWCIASTALAGNVTASIGGLTGGGMPWDKGINSWRNSAVNVICPAMIIGGIIAGAWDAMKHGEFTTFAGRSLIVMLAGAMGLGANGLVNSFTSAGGLLQ